GIARLTAQEKIDDELLRPDKPASLRLRTAASVPRAPRRASIHPGGDLDEARRRTGWPLEGSPQLSTTAPPGDADLQTLRRRVDPVGIRRLEFVTGAERRALIDEILKLEDAALERALSHPDTVTAAS